MFLKDLNKFNSDFLDGKHASNSGGSVPILDANAKLPLAQIPTGSTKDTVSLGNHTHAYAGSSSVGGAATSALKCTGNSATATTLETARTINGTSFILNVDHFLKTKYTIGCITGGMSSGTDIQQV